ncbi:hypothetical protein [Sphingomicrobium sediminis]|uniref:Uncharacterized protein n=1 Tax=Sphingomicrobium sediminis TaxID=2950949 RepID=A0A9X2J2J1_9SPHN|nr:hypothetical protein [Sphingomicrobium sediminis]MCM8556346.1 hypothetical protein [Sphingomicrobium sediminis]
MRSLAILGLFVLASCGTNANGPSLAERPAEAIDPRLPVGSAEPDLGQLTIEAQLADIRARANSAISAYEALLLETFELVSVAGPPGSESWVTAQEAVSLLEVARAPLPIALGDLDQLITVPIGAEGWSSPADREAARRVMQALLMIDAQQASTIEEMSIRLAN